MSESCAKYTQISAFIKQVIQAFDLILMSVKFVFLSIAPASNAHQFSLWLAERKELRQAERVQRTTIFIYPGATMTTSLSKHFIVFISLFLFGMTQKSPTPDPTKMEITDATFKCLTQMTRVRGFYVDNLLGNLEGTLKVANSTTGGKYPPGSVIQLVPTEVMVKHAEGWNKATNDWEFFELTVTEAGSKIKVRGATEVVNRFGGNCFSCHVKAKPEWDLICESDHGCAPIPLKPEQIAAIQKGDPRCKK